MIIISIKRVFSFIDKNKISIIVFLAVGILTALINFLSFSLFWEVTGLSYTLAASMAYFLSVAFHFTANRSITFRSSGSDFTLQMIKYIGLVILNYFAMIGIVRFTVEVLKASPYVGLIVTMIIMAIISYMLSKYWVFKLKTVE